MMDFILRVFTLAAACTTLSASQALNHYQREISSPALRFQAQSTPGAGAGGTCKVKESKLSVKFPLPVPTAHCPECQVNLKDETKCIATQAQLDKRKTQGGSGSKAPAGQPNDPQQMCDYYCVPDTEVVSGCDGSKNDKMINAGDDGSETARFSKAKCESNFCITVGNKCLKNEGVVDPMPEQLPDFNCDYYCDPKASGVGANAAGEETPKPNAEAAEDKKIKELFDLACTSFDCQETKPSVLSKSLLKNLLGKPENKQLKELLMPVGFGWQEVFAAMGLGEGLGEITFGMWSKFYKDYMPDDF